MITFITGGGRSGKSTYAEQKASIYEKKVYVATALAFDDEMKFRINEHLKQRGDAWITIEKYDGIAKELEQKAEKTNVILVDCLTNLVSNMMIMDKDIDWDSLRDEEVAVIEKGILAEVDSLLEYGKNYAGEMIFVANEVGMGLVPVNPLARRFRDIAGRINQRVANAADEAFFVVAGLPLKLK